MPNQRQPRGSPGCDESTPVQASLRSPTATLQSRESVLASFAVPAQSRRFLSRRAVRPILVERPMPATEQDIRELRAILAWARSTNADKQTRERLLAEALDRAIAYLDAPDRRKNVMLWILSALRQSMRRDGRFWIVVDRDLNEWAMEQLEVMFPEGA